jgi:hypothetical protein
VGAGAENSRRDQADETKSSNWRSKLDTGLDCSTDDFTPDEQESLVAWYQEKHGLGDMSLNRFAEILLEYYPAGMKRWRNAAIQLTAPEPAGTGLPQDAFGLFYLHLYSVIQNDKGILYSMVSCRNGGRSKAEVLDTIKFAFVTGGPMALNSIAERSSEYLDQWSDERSASTIDWPESWGEVQQNWASPLDKGYPELSVEDEASLRQWQLETTGEVFPHHAIMSRLHPGAYKALRQRMDGVFEVLPQQMAPLFGLHLATYQVWPTIVRRCVLQARGLGVNRYSVVQTIASGALTAPDWKLEAAIGPILPILENWE